MLRRLFIFYLVFLGCTVSAFGEDGGKQEVEGSGLSYVQALILGTIQGVTEFLPISSTGHLILANEAMKLNAGDVVLDKEGEPILSKRRGAERAYTVKDAVDSYAIIIQGGTILAILFLYWGRILWILKGLMGRNRRGVRLARNIILAFIPAACLGLLLGSWIEEHLFSSGTVILALIVGAVLMFIVERVRRGEGKEEEMDLDELSVKQCLTIGGLQCLAMWPGTSRSMMTIVGGYVAGLSPARAAEFSFLLGLVTLSAASLYKIVSDGGNMARVLSMGPAIFGCGVAFVTGAIAVKWLVGYLTKHGLSLFAWYRLGLAMVILLAN